MSDTRERPGHNPCLTSVTNFLGNVVAFGRDRKNIMDAFPKKHPHIYKRRIKWLRHFLMHGQGCSTGAVRVWPTNET